MTYISDTTQALDDVIFPSVTICNVNQMKQSLIEKASLPSAEYKEYLINYFFLGSNKSSEPTNWKQTLQNIQYNLGWNRSRDSFNKFVSQVIDVTRISSIRVKFFVDF